MKIDIIPFDFQDEANSLKVYFKLFLSEFMKSETMNPDGEMVVKPIDKPDWTLDGLLVGINKKNLYKEIETGPATGNEIW